MNKNIAIHANLIIYFPKMCPLRQIYPFIIGYHIDTLTLLSSFSIT